MLFNKRPAKAFTPHAEKKIGTGWSIVKSKRVTGLCLKMLFTSPLKVKGNAIRVNWSKLKSLQVYVVPI